MHKIFVGVPVLNRLDLTSKCIRAIDYPSEVVVVNNNCTDESFSSVLDSWALEKKVRILHQRKNLGVSASWNLILQTGFDAGYERVFIGSNDTFLHPGSLKAAVEVSQNRLFGIWHLHAFNFFLISREAVDAVGWFDENFYPAYKEDQDYSYRCLLAGVSRLADIPGCSADHVGSATIHSDPDLLVSNGRTHQLNTEYYAAKWGGDAGEEVFRHPYNNPGYDHKWWRTPELKD